MPCATSTSATITHLDASLLQVCNGNIVFLNDAQTHTQIIYILFTSHPHFVECADDKKRLSFLFCTNFLTVFLSCMLLLLLMIGFHIFPSRSTEQFSVYSTGNASSELMKIPDLVERALVSLYKHFINTHTSSWVEGARECHGVSAHPRFLGGFNKKRTHTPHCLFPCISIPLGGTIRSLMWIRIPSKEGAHI